MYIDILPTAQSALNYNFRDKIAVVVDVLRATSVISTALNNGAKNVITVANIDDALNMRQSNNNIILGGERNALKIEGFDLDNSPLSYTRNIVAGKTIILTTTNGTQAVNNCHDASEIFIASFLNATKIIEHLLMFNKDIIIICAGTEGNFSIEDAICAGFIAKRISSITNATLSDFAIAMTATYDISDNNLHMLASRGKHYNNLINKGFRTDIDYCFQILDFPIVKLFPSGFQQITNA